MNDDPTTRRPAYPGNMGSLLIIGSGGFGRETAQAALDGGFAGDVLGFLDDDPARQGTFVNGLPIVGPIDAIKDRGVDAAIIGVNSDAYVSAPEDTAYYLTSVMKNLTTATKEVTLAAANGDFDNKPYIGTLENGGVGIAPAHDWESKLDPALLAEVEELQNAIISGDFTVTSPSSPKA